MKKTLTFDQPSQLPSFEPIIGWSFPFNMVDSSLVGAPEEKSRTSPHHIQVAATLQLIAVWGFYFAGGVYKQSENDNYNLMKVLFEHGKRYVVKRLQDTGELALIEKLELDTSSPETRDHFDPSRIQDPVGATLEVEAAVDAGRNREVSGPENRMNSTDSRPNAWSDRKAPTKPEFPRALRVFLCHSSDDKPSVRELYRRLSADNIDPWLDEEKLLPGQDWSQEIMKAVRATDVVIVCLSRGSVNKAGYIQKEIKYALDIADEQPEGTIFLIPLKLEECEIPERLRRWQWVNYFDENSYKRLMNALKVRAQNLGVKASPELPVSQVMKKYEGQRIKAKGNDRKDQFFVLKGELHYIDLGAAEMCEKNGLPYMVLEAEEEFILTQTARGDDLNALQMKAVLDKTSIANHTQKAVILTSLRLEYMAVCSHLSDLQEETHPQGTVYGHGKFLSGAQMWDVAVVEIGQGISKAAMEAERAIRYFEPVVAIFVGVAGGVKDVALGDVVAATKIYEYGSGKDEETFKPRPNVWSSTYRMEQRARAEARKDNWLQRIKGLGTASKPRAFIGPIAAGPKVVASTRSTTYQLLRSYYNDTLAVEMEGYGFLEAVRANLGVEALVIRGISDLIDAKTEADASGSQEIAAQNASAFAFEVFANFVIPAEPSTGDRSDIARRNVLPISQEPLSQKVSLQVWNGQYVCAEEGGGGKVLANRSEIDEWATFDLIELEGDSIRLRAWKGDYVCAESGGGREVFANRQVPSSWETFKLEKREDGKVYLRTHIGQYVCAENGGGGEVTTKQNVPHEWAAFKLIRHNTASNLWPLAQKP